MRSFRVGLIAFTLIGLVAPVRAAEVDKHLPDDTEMIICLNIRQILDSTIVKKNTLETIKEAIKSEDQVQKVIKALGVDPLKDLDSILIAAPGGSDPEKGLIVVTGKFDPDKLDAGIEQLAKDVKMIKPLKIGAYKGYEVSVPDSPTPMFVAVASKSTILAASSKDSLIDGMDKATGKKKLALKSKELQGLLAKIDAKQSLWIAIPATAIPKDIPIDNDTVKTTLAVIEAVSGGITISDDITLEVLVSTKDADGAKTFVKNANDGLTQAKGLILLAGGAQLAPLADALGTVKITAKDKSVTIKGAISAEVIEKLSKPGGQ